jgi:hypothetical protein
LEKGGVVGAGADMEGGGRRRREATRDVTVAAARERYFGLGWVGLSRSSDSEWSGAGRRNGGKWATELRREQVERDACGFLRF